MTAPWEVESEILAPWERVDTSVIPIVEEEDGFDRFVEGVTSVDPLEDNISAKVGGMFVENKFKQFGFDEVVETNERAKKFEQWQPRIWAMQDRMQSITDKRLLLQWLRVCELWF